MAEIEYNGWDQFKTDKFAENFEGDIKYEIQKCPRCGVRHLIKVTRERPVLSMDEVDAETSLSCLIFPCVRCGRWRWFVVDKWEIVDVY